MYRDHKGRGFCATPKPAWYLLSDSLGVLVRHSQAQNVFRSILNLFILDLANFSTDWLTDLLMPSDKHNLKTARDKDLISSLINVTSSLDVSFQQPQQLQCLHHGDTFVLLWSPIVFSQQRKVTICGRHVMASVQDIQIAEALLVLCLVYYVMKRVWHCWNWGVMVFTYWDMGHAFQEHILHVFCNGWMDCRDTFHTILCLYCYVTDRT